MGYGLVSLYYGDCSISKGICIYCNESIMLGDDPMDLSSNTLTDDHKKWFAQQLLDKVQTKASLALKYNLKPHTLRKWKDCLWIEFHSLVRWVDLLCGTAVHWKRCKIVSMMENIR